MATERPPLGLQAELVYPDGTTSRFDSDAREAKDTPQGISFKTQRYTGFADASFTLPRPIDRDYPDLGLLDAINLIGHDGAVAYEGWAGSIPRSLQGTPQISLQMQGWMQSAKDQTFTEVYVDRDLSKWTTPGRARVAALLAENRSPGSVGQNLDEAGNPSVELSFQDAWVSPYKPVVEAWWLPRAGIPIGALYYALTGFNSSTMSTGDANWFVEAYLANDDKASGLDASGSLWFPPKSGYLEATATTRTAAFLQLLYNATPAGLAGATYNLQYEKLAVYGNHGLPRRGENPGGFYVSEMIANIANRFAPKLNTLSMKETTFIVPQASFLDETAPYDAWQTLNAYHRWEMAVYEDRKLLYYPIDLTDYDWQIRTDEPGTTLDLQGDDSAHLCNGVTVRYTDLDTGYETRLSPNDFSELRDNAPDNPANLNGRKLYTPMSLSVPTTQEGAIQIGRTFLAEFNQAAAPGTITVKGHVRDRAGHWQQAWKVRAGDRIVLSNQPNDSVRVVGETSWDHKTKTLTIAVDSSLKRLDPILARLGVAIEASNLALP
jgi:hypothetical protein